MNNATFKDNPKRLSFFLEFMEKYVNIIDKMSRKLYNNRDKNKRVYEKPVYSNLIKEYIPANRETSFMSGTTSLVIEALRTFGKDRVDDAILRRLQCS